MGICFVVLLGFICLFFVAHSNPLSLGKGRQFPLSDDLCFTVFSCDRTCQIRSLVKRDIVTQHQPLSLSGDLESFLLELILLRGCQPGVLFISSWYLDPYSHPAFCIFWNSFQPFLWFPEFHMLPILSPLVKSTREFMYY